MDVAKRNDAEYHMPNDGNPGKMKKL